MNSSHASQLLKHLYLVVPTRQQTRQAQERMGLEARRKFWTSLEPLESRTLLSASVTAATGGTNLSADKAFNAASGAFTTLGNIVVTEGTMGDIAIGTGGNDKTLILSAPSGWQFNPGLGTMTYTAGRDITAGAVAVTQTTITLSYTVATITNLDTLTISGIQIQATDGHNIGSTARLLKTGGTGTVTGITTSTNFGSLSQAAGATSQLGFSVQPLDTVVGVVMSPAVKVQFQDQFGNLTSSTASVAVAIGNNPAGGTLSGTTTVAASSGTATFNSLSIDILGQGYTLAAASGTFSGTSSPFDIVKRTPTVSVASSDTASVYGQSITFTATVTGTTYLPTGTVDFMCDTTYLGTAALNGTGVTATATFTTNLLAAGSYVIYGVYSGDANFNSATNSGRSQSVSKAALTVTTDPATRVYGDPNPAFTYVIAGFKNGETLETSGVTGNPVLTTTATLASNVNTYAITTGAGTLAAANYSFTRVNGTLTVTKAPLTVTCNGTRAYGDANGLTATYIGFKNGQNYVSSDLTGSPSLITAATATSSPGSYPIAVARGTLASNNYSFETFIDGTLTVNPAVLTVTAANASKAYGDDNPVLTCSYTGFKNSETLATSGVAGEASITTVADASSGAGAYPILADLGTLSAVNYTFATVNATLTVNKAALTVTANSATRVYGDANPTFTASYSGFKLGQTVETSDLTGSPALTTTATVTSNVNTYTITAAVGTLASNNYSLTFANGTLTLTKAPLTANADSKSRLYGASNPSLTASYVGFKNGQNFSSSDLVGAPGLTTPAVVASPAGDYPIAITQGTLASNNYYFAAFNDGTFTVNPATLTVTASNASRAYGNPDPAFAVTYSGFKNNENLATSGVTGGPGFTTTATATSAPGTYVITPNLSTLAANNYIFAFDTGTLTVNKAVLTVTADPRERLYGDANPVFTATIAGFKNGEILETSGVTGAPSVTCSAAATSAVGAKTINVSRGTLLATNYSFTYVSGTMMVNKAPLVVTADDATRAYGDANSFTASFSGFKNSQTLATSGVAGSASLTSDATPLSELGTYVITSSLGTLAAGNYYFATFSPGTLTVEKAVLTVQASNLSKPYGDENPALTAVYTGFKNGQTLETSDVTGSPSLSTSADVFSPVGAYPIDLVPSTLDSGHYSFVLASGTLTVTPAVLTVATDSASRIYGNENPSFTYSYGGFKNGQSLETSGVTGAPDLSTPATTDSGAGAYPINCTIGTLVATNYSFNCVASTLNVDKAQLTVTADDATRQFGQPNQVFTASYSGFRLGEDLATSGVTGSPELTTTADLFSPAGSYPIVAAVGTLAAANYDFVFVSATLTVEGEPAVSPTPSGIALADGADTGNSPTDNLTRISSGLSVLVSGVTVGATVEVYEGSTLVGSVAREFVTGTSVVVVTDVGVVFADGSHSLCARQTVPGMTESELCGPLVVEIDATAPTVTTAARTGLTNFSLTFSEDVSATLLASSLSLHNNTTGGDISPSAVTMLYDAPTCTATWTVTRALPGGDYILTLGTAGLIDAAGNSVTGNGGGAGGTDYAAPFTVLSGDLNYDNTVNAADIDLLVSMFGENPLYDLTNDAIVNGADKDCLVRTILQIAYGDANLDHKVSFTDFQAVLNNWQQHDVGWASGDFNGDHWSTFTDFQVVLNNWNPSGQPTGVAEKDSTITTAPFASPATVGSISPDISANVAVPATVNSPLEVASRASSASTAETTSANVSAPPDIAGRKLTTRSHANKPHPAAKLHDVLENALPQFTYQAVLQA